MDKYGEVAERIRKNGSVMAFTGAGISVDSGIPAFRGAQGLWEKYDPTEYAHINSFRNDPAKIWVVLREMTQLIFDAQPSPAHMALATLEETGFLNTVVTQNVDGLHQLAGNTHVIEYHGSSRNLICLECGKRTPFTRESLAVMPYPVCATCDAALKPDGVFFGEQIPRSAIESAYESIETCNMLMIIGTSGMVYPAAEIPFLAASKGAAIVEINLDPSPFTSKVTQFYLEGSASKVLPEILTELD